MHATGYVSSDVTEDRYFFTHVTGVETYVSGIDVEKGELHAESKLRLFRLFNEGITDQIAHEVLLEYLRRVPHTASPAVYKRISLLSLANNIQSGSSAYDAARHMVMALVGAIAQDVGVTEDVVWRGFVRHYYSGEITPGDFIALLAESFGVEFVERLAQAQNGTDLRELALSVRKISTHYPDVAKKWIDHLHLSRGAQ